MSPSPAACRSCSTLALGSASSARSSPAVCSSRSICRACTPTRSGASTAATSSAFAWASLSDSTSSATASVMSARSASRRSAASAPVAIARCRRILMFTSWSEVSTPAELSMASVLMRPPASAYSTRARWVNPRLPPSPTTRHRSSVASMRTVSLVRSPASAFVSVDAFTKVPIPPFQRRSTGARRIALTTSSGVSAPPRSTARSGSPMPSTRRAASDRSTDLAARGYTPPPGESTAGS